MRGTLGFQNPLEVALDNLLRLAQPEDIVIPKGLTVADMRWQLDSGESRLVENCSKEELLQIVQSLINHIYNQQVKIEALATKDTNFLNLMETPQNECR